MPLTLDIWKGHSKHAINGKFGIHHIWCVQFDKVVLSSLRYFDLSLFPGQKTGFHKESRHSPSAAKKERRTKDASGGIAAAAAAIAVPSVSLQKIAVTHEKRQNEEERRTEHPVFGTLLGSWTKLPGRSINVRWFKT